MKNSLARSGISPEKLEAFNLLLKRKGISPSSVQPITRRKDQHSPVAVSFAQQRLWFLDQLEPGSPFYNMHSGVRFVGPLNHDLLAKAFTEVVRRHESLRTRFEVIDGKPLQIVAAPGPVRLE